MMKLSNSAWFTEVCEESGSAFSLKLNGECLHRETTPYQTIEIFDTTHFGKLMVIDGFSMVSSLDNFFYHEMLSHPALFTHSAPSKVVIIGGGDCGTLKEVLKHDEVHEVWQIEIDEGVTRLSEKYFPELCESNADPRAHLCFEDGIKWMNNAKKNSIDLIIVDSTDPIGPAIDLFTDDFYRSCHKALKEDGILVQQSESPLVHTNIIRAMHHAIRSASFSEIQLLTFPQPIYPTGLWSATMASKGGDLTKFRQIDAEQKELQTRYYDARIHSAAMSIPGFIKESLKLID